MYCRCYFFNVYPGTGMTSPCSDEWTSINLKRNPWYIVYPPHPGGMLIYIPPPGACSYLSPPGACWYIFPPPGGMLLQGVRTEIIWARMKLMSSKDMDISGIPFFVWNEKKYRFFRLSICTVSHMCKKGTTFIPDMIFIIKATVGIDLWLLHQFKLKLNK